MDESDALTAGIMNLVLTDLKGLRARAEGRKLDFYKFVVSEATGIPIDRVSSEQREVAKSVLFFLAYGVSTAKPTPEALDKIRKWKDRWKQQG
jgi:hypothetical protein